MIKATFYALVALVSCAIGQNTTATTTGVAAGALPTYYANLTFQAPRSLSNWSNLTVETRTGRFIGFLNDTQPNVRQFLRVPFAKPPIGELRWEAPQRLEDSRKTYDSTFFGPGCPQYVPVTTSIYSLYGAIANPLAVGESLNQGSTLWSSAEDCLSLAVWTPANATKDSKLPVALFVTGGGGDHGQVWIPSQLPTPWVSRSQEHIVVTINYRANIFGNPKSRAMKETSLTLLDVRAAVEWVSENIEAFGGNTDNIMLWGQSQGAALTHLYTLAFPDDPLVAKFGIISQPPSVTINLTAVNDVYSDFDIVAKGLGCNYGDNPEAEFACMKELSWVQIMEYYKRYNSTPSIAFSTYVPDEKYIFADETERYIQGKVAKGPVIRSDAERESPSANLTSTLTAQKQWNCAAAADAPMRKALGLDTYRYYWAGNFSNISPEPWLGAWHWSDLLMIFGTYFLDLGEIPQLEVKTSLKMQDYILAFIKDPNSLPGLGWPAFDSEEAKGGTIIQFGKDVAVKNVTGDYLDAVCYNASETARIWG